MSTPEKHALLSASSAERWMHCTRAPRLEETLPEHTSEYAEEGRLAHAIAELKVRKKFTPMSTRAFNAEMKKLKADPLYQEEMQEHTDTYLEYITERAMRYSSTPHVAVERRLDFSRFVPEGFGTGDCVMIGGGLLRIIDLKYGKGVPVDAGHNPQMMLYALGALEAYLPIYGDTIKQVCVSIVQPRLDSTSEFLISRDELIDWGMNEAKPKAETAFKGEGDFLPGDWCRFCRARATCRARSENATALEDFGFAKPPLLTDAEVGEILQKAKELSKWAADLEDYALQAELSGRDIPGWKAVEGRSNRQFTDIDAAFARLESEGVAEEMLYERRPITLTAAEKLIGKTKFDDLMAGYVIKPPGKPTLAPDSDKRPPYSPAAADFAGAAN